MTRQLIDNRSANRFELRSHGDLAGFLDYERGGGRIVLLHTEVDERFRRLGLGAALISYALDGARREGLAVEPHCSFVAVYLEKERAQRPGRDRSLTGIPGIGRATAIGALLGAIVVGAAVTFVLLLAGAGPAAVAAAAHVGFFGGMGFGGMLGAVIQSDRFHQDGERMSAASTNSDVPAECALDDRPSLSALQGGRSTKTTYGEGVDHAEVQLPARTHAAGS